MSKLLLLASEGGKKGGILENFEIRYKHRNICGKIQGIQWCTLFFYNFNIKQAIAICRLFFAKILGFWRSIDPPSDNKIGMLPFKSIFYLQMKHIVKNNIFLYLIPKKIPKLKK